MFNCGLFKVLPFEARVAEAEAPHLNPSGSPSFLCTNFTAT